MPSDGRGHWLGAASLDDHRTCGGRAWCACGEWCSESCLCRCCYRNTQMMADYEQVRTQLMKAEWPTGGHGTLDRSLEALARLAEQ